MILHLDDRDRFFAVLEALSQYVDNNSECEEPVPHQAAAEGLLEEMEAELAAVAK